MKTNKRWFLGTVVLVGVVALTCSTAVAETYYVSLKGDDANKGMTEKAAFRTIKKGVSVLKAGDTLIIKSGDYGTDQAVVLASGTKDAPIAIKAEKPGEVVLRGNGKGRGLYIRNKSHIIVDGLKFTNFATGIDIIRKSSYITVRRCIFQTNHGQGLRLIGIRKSPGDSHHHTFTRNQFLDFAETGPGSPTSGGGIQDYGIQMYYATNVKATNNYFYGHHHQCISFKAVMHDSVAANNVFEGFYYSAIILGQNSDHNPKYTSRNHNLTAEGNIFRPAPPYRAKSAVVVSNVTGAIVRNNFIDSTYGEDKPGERCLPGGGIHVTPLAVGTKIYGNVLVNIKEPKAALLIRADCEIYNNTVVGCARALEIIKGVKAVVKNNIFYKNAKQMGVAAPMGKFYEKYFRKLAKDGVMGEVTADLSKKNVFDYNLWFPDWKGKGPHAISADPGFVGPVKPLVIKKASPKYVPNFERMKAYRLKKSSPCIDKGVKTDLPFIGKAADIGAFEFGEKPKKKIKETKSK